jgi:hypothetical protein
MYNSSYANNSTTSRQAGVLFGTNSSFSGNTASSDIKTAIDNWYTSNLSTTYGSHLEPSAGFCGDRTVYNTSNTIQAETTKIAQYSTSTTVFYFGARTRNMTTAQNPSLTCAKYGSVDRSTVDLYTTSSAPNGNKMLTNPIALITADEASFAGSGSNTATNGSSYHANSFLNSGSYFWLLSPRERFSNGYSYMFTLNEGGYIGGQYGYYTWGVRPAISLTQGTKISSGSGTATDPWEVTW